MGYNISYCKTHKVDRDTLRFKEHILCIKLYSVKQVVYCIEIPFFISFYLYISW